jgi:hypothetical protein
LSTTPNPAPKPYYIRGYKVVVNHAGEDLTLTDSLWEPEALRARFKVVIGADVQAWWGEITVWNLSASLEQTLLTAGQPSTAASANTPIVQGDLLTISAGYQLNFDPVSNVIFEGTVFQPTWDRENVTDFKVTLRAIIDPLNLGYMSFTMGPYQTQAKVIQAMAAGAHVPIEQVDDSALPPAPLPRAKPIFGTAKDVLEGVQRTTDARIWVSDKGLNVRPLQGTPQPADLVFGPSAAGTSYRPTAGSTATYTPTLIGTPQQTEKGVIFRVLMDSRIKMASIVKLDQSVIRQLPRYPGGATLSFLDQDGSYVVAGMTHLGDTRGQEWYTDVTAVTLDYWSAYQQTLVNSML